MAYDLAGFSVLEMIRCSGSMRRVTDGSRSMEAAAQNVVRFIYEIFRDSRGARQCALVRFYRTQSYAGLPKDLRAFARERLNVAEPDDSLRSLVLLGTAGEVEAWNDRRLSVGHKAIPLPSVEIVEQAPMISQLIREVGFDLAEVVKPPIGILHDQKGKTYNIFHVEEAFGSPFIPAQDEFVIPFGVQSVIGFGGLTTTGEFFAVVIFAKTRVPRESAVRFRSVAIELNAALFGLSRVPMFEEDREALPPGEIPPS